MRTEQRSTVDGDGTAWSVEATLDGERLRVEVLGAAPRDGTIEVQVLIEGGERHLVMLEEVARELRGSLFDHPRRRVPRRDSLASDRFVSEEVRPTG